MKFIIAYFCPLENNFQWLFAGIGLCLLAILIRKNIRLKREKEESKQEENRLREEIGYLRLSQALIENRMFRMYSRNYPKIKPLIEQKGDSKKCFNIEEYQELRYEIETFFEESIHKMRTACPILTNGDIVFLCLSKLKLPDA
ncbi:MAG: hypothetical protein LBO74_02170, partial [Candidatus Symbiothrix sp.]|nr:hypothetical protein [Candidatus Symbiothrix sp.]